MTKINLLDWRTAKRERLKRQFYAILGLAVTVSVAVVLAGLVLMNGAIDHQQERNAYIQQQIDELDKQIKEIQDLEKVRHDLQARIKVIEQLQQSRTATVHFFDEIVNTLPDGIYLKAVKQSGQTVNIKGIAESNGRISTYMKNLDASPWFKDPKLVVIRTSAANRLRSSEFELTVTNLTKATAEAAGAAK
jgi:type IV pilus assembly protein PilN